MSTESLKSVVRNISNFPVDGIEFKDITDSKEFIESKVPNFVLVFTYLITFFLLILLINGLTLSPIKSPFDVANK